MCTHAGTHACTHTHTHTHTHTQVSVVEPKEDAMIVEPYSEQKAAKPVDSYAQPSL